MELNDKLLEKAKNAKSAEELVTLAKENGIQLTDEEAKTVEELAAVAKENGFELTAEEAKTYFDQLNPKTGELNDDELDNVAGGKKCGTLYDGGRPIVVPSSNTCEYWRDKTTCEAIPEGGKCSSCLYCHTRTLGWVCMAAERYDN